MTERQAYFDKHGACKSGQSWVKKHCPGDDLASLYDYLSKSNTPKGGEYFDWLWPRSFDDKTLRLLAVRLVRETPLADGRKVFDLLTDPRSINALVVAEKFAHGLCSEEDLAAARTAAVAAALAARDAARTAARNAGDAWDAAGALDAARAAQKQMILELGNPWRTK